MTWELASSNLNRQSNRLDLTNCNLGKAKFDNLDFSFADFSGSYMELASMYKTDLRGAVFHRSHLQAVELNEAVAEEALLIEASMQGAYLIGAHLEAANLSFANLEGANLVRAHLYAADFSSANLKGTHLIGAHLSGANLDSADLTNAYIVSAHTNDASVDATNLISVGGLTQQMVDAMWGDDETQLPDSITRPTNERWVNEAGHVAEGRFDRWQARHIFWRKYSQDLQRKMND